MLEADTALKVTALKVTDLISCTTPPFCRRKSFCSQVKRHREIKKLILFFFSGLFLRQFCSLVRLRAT